MQRERLGAVGERPLVVPGERVAPADGVERLGEPLPVAAVTEDADRPAGVVDGLGQPFLADQQPAQAQVGVGRPVAVVQRLEQVQGAPEVGAGLLVVAEPGVRPAEGQCDAGLRSGVARTAGGGQRRGLDHDPVLGLSLPLESGLNS